MTATATEADLLDAIGDQRRAEESARAAAETCEHQRAYTQAQAASYELWAAAHDAGHSYEAIGEAAGGLTKAYVRRKVVEHREQT